MVIHPFNSSCDTGKRFVGYCSHVFGVFRNWITLSKDNHFITFFRLNIGNVNHRHVHTNIADDETPEPHTRAIGEEQVVKAATGLIANTDAEVASLVSLYDACPDNVFVVAPGVDLQSFSSS